MVATSSSQLCIQWSMNLACPLGKVGLADTGLQLRKPGNGLHAKRPPWVSSACTLYTVIKFVCVCVSWSILRMDVLSTAICACTRSWNLERSITSRNKFLKVLSCHSEKLPLFLSPTDIMDEYHIMTEKNVPPVWAFLAVGECSSLVLFSSAKIDFSSCLPPMQSWINYDHLSPVILQSTHLLQKWQYLHPTSTITTGGGLAIMQPRETCLRARHDGGTITTLTCMMEPIG